MFLMAGCQEALDPENSKFGWQNAQTKWEDTANSGWSMSFNAYTCSYIKIYAAKHIFRYTRDRNALMYMFFFVIYVRLVYGPALIIFLQTTGSGFP